MFNAFTFSAVNNNLPVGVSKSVILRLVTCKDRSKKIYVTGKI